MSNHIIDYYKNQAGSGLAGFQGYKHQKGHGFGSFFKSIWRNIVPYFAPKLVSAGVKVGNDFLGGQNIKSSLSTRLRETGGEILDDATTRAKKFIQTGKGRRRKSRKTKTTAKTNLLKMLKMKNLKSKRSKRKRKKPVTKRKRKSKQQQFDHLF